MHDKELTARVTASAPSIAQRDRRLYAAIDDVVTESRRPRPRRKRLFITGATLSVLLLGGTTMALATPSLLDWLGCTPDQTIKHVNADGDLCAAGMVVQPYGVPDDDAKHIASRQPLVQGCRNPPITYRSVWPRRLNGEPVRWSVR
jgi:hypothetical protein